MSPEQFVYWLRGFFELSGAEELTKEQVEMISKHLSLVFDHKAKDMPKISYDGGRSWGDIKPLDVDTKISKVYCSTADSVSVGVYCVDGANCSNKLCTTCNNAPSRRTTVSC